MRERILISILFRNLPFYTSHFPFCRTFPSVTLYLKLPLSLSSSFSPLLFLRSDWTSHPSPPCSTAFIHSWLSSRLRPRPPQEIVPSLQRSLPQPLPFPSKPPCNLLLPPPFKENAAASFLIDAGPFQTAIDAGSHFREGVSRRSLVLSAFGSCIVQFPRATRC